MNIKDGDVFNWSWKECKSNGSDAYWCMDGQCVAREVKGEILLFDTYWFNQWSNKDVLFCYDGFDRNNSKLLNPDRVNLEFVCNANEVRQIDKGYSQDYDKVYNLSYQKNCYPYYAVDKDAQPSNKAIIAKYERKIQKAQEAKRSAEWDIEYYSRLIQELLK